MNYKITLIFKKNNPETIKNPRKQQLKTQQNQPINQAKKKKPNSKPEKQTNKETKQTNQTTKNESRKIRKSQAVASHSKFAITGGLVLK